MGRWFAGEYVDVNKQMDHSAADGSSVEVLSFA